MKFMGTRAYKFRLYPNAKRQETIDESMNLARNFYNRILERSIRERRVSMRAQDGYADDIAEGDKHFKLLYSQTRQDIRIRVTRAYQNFFRRCKDKSGKNGFPKFKSHDKYGSITYPQDDGSFQIGRIGGFIRLRVARIGTMRMKVYRGVEGRIKTLTIAKEGRDYYAILTTAQESSDRHCIKKWEERRNLEDRIHHCNRCGMQLGSDMNASINILDRATLGHGGSHAQVESVILQQGAAVVELRAYSDKIIDAWVAHSF